MFSGWGNMMMGDYGSGGYWMMGMAGIGMHLIFGIGMILLLIYLFRRNAPHVHTGGLAKHRAIDILRERYARGEIDSVEYQTRKQELEGK